MQKALDDRLRRQGVACRFLPSQREERRADHIELDIQLREAPYTVGIHITTKRDDNWKASHIRRTITDFLHEAITRGEEAAPRIYLEVLDLVGHRVNLVAERLALTVRDIVNDLKQWMEQLEVGRAIGLRLVLHEDRRTELFPIRLLKLVSQSARNWLCSLLAPEPCEESVVVHAQPEPATVANPPTQPTRPKPSKFGPPPLLAQMYHRFISALHSRRPHLDHVPAYAGRRR